MTDDEKASTLVGSAPPSRGSSLSVPKDRPASATAPVERAAERAAVPVDEPPDPFLVTWDGPDDPCNPRNFGRRRKWLLSMLGTVFCGAVSIVVSAYSITIGSLQRDLHCSRIVALLGVTTFILTFGSAPLVLAPLSEVYGRHPLYLGSAVAFTLFILAQALAQNIETIIICRFFCGIGGSTGVAVVGGTLADLWDDADRALPMNIFAMTAFMTTGLGPLLFGFVEQRTDHGWRYTQWAIFGLGGLLCLFFVAVSRETRANVLLVRKAKRLRASTGEARWHAAAELERRSFRTMATVALLRPLRMLFTEPVVTAFSTWLAFCWTVLYLVLISLPFILAEVWGFDTEQVGLAFTSQVVASFVALGIMCYGDVLYQRHVARLGPEARLYPALLAGLLFPVGMWACAWLTYASVPWAVYLVFIGVIYISLQLCYSSCFSYLADSYQIYAASALSAQTFLRNMSGSVSPLYTTQLYHNLGFHAAGSMLAAIATLLSVTPYLLFRYGRRLRERSPFAVLLAAEREREANDSRRPSIVPVADKGVEQGEKA